MVVRTCCAFELHHSIVFMNQKQVAAKRTEMHLLSVCNYPYNQTIDAIPTEEAPRITGKSETYEYTPHKPLFLYKAHV